MNSQTNGISWCTQSVCSLRNVLPPEIFYPCGSFFFRAPSNTLFWVLVAGYDKHSLSHPATNIHHNMIIPYNENTCLKFYSNWHRLIRRLGPIHKASLYFHKRTSINRSRFTSSAFFSFWFFIYVQHNTNDISRLIFLSFLLRCSP